MLIIHRLFNALLAGIFGTLALALYAIAVVSVLSAIFTDQGLTAGIAGAVSAISAAMLTELVNHCSAAGRADLYGHW